MCPKHVGDSSLAALVIISSSQHVLRCAKNRPCVIRVPTAGGLRLGRVDRNETDLPAPSNGWSKCEQASSRQSARTCVGRPHRCGESGPRTGACQVPGNLPGGPPHVRLRAAQMWSEHTLLAGVLVGSKRVLSGSEVAPLAPGVGRLPPPWIRTHSGKNFRSLAG